DARREALRRAFLHVPAQIKPALGDVLEILQRRRLDRVDGDALARGENADNTVARYCSAVGRKSHRQIGVDAADRNCGAWLSGNLRFDGLGSLEPEPAAFRLRLLR